MSEKVKKFSAVMIVILLLIGCLIGSGIFEVSQRKDRSDTDANKHYVAFITKSTKSSFWKNVFAGANAASSEYNLEITLDGPQNEEDYEAQNTMIQEAVQNGAEVIVFSAVDYIANAQAIDDAAKQGVKIIVIDSDVNSSMVSCRISTDNYLAGRMAGEEALQNKEKVLYIGIVNFDKNSANGQQREQGFRDVVSKDKCVTIIDAINVNSTINESKEETKLMLAKHPQIDVIATFNEWTSLGVGYAIQEMRLADETTVIAFDCNVISVGMLESGEVDGLIVQNPYAMGYLGVEYAYRLINNLPIEQTNIDTSTTLVTKENMYDSECQRALFSFN